MASFFNKRSAEEIKQEIADIKKLSLRPAILISQIKKPETQNTILFNNPFQSENKIKPIKRRR